MADVDSEKQVNEIALRYANNIREHVQLRRLYVYGSYAKGTFTAESDIDIAVVADGFSGDIIEDRWMLMKLRRTVDNRIEPHPFSTKDFNESDPMAKEVMETGIRII